MNKIPILLGKAYGFPWIKEVFVPETMEDAMAQIQRPMHMTDNEGFVMATGIVISANLHGYYGVITGVHFDTEKQLRERNNQD
jgi:hypothetical protein